MFHLTGTPISCIRWVQRNVTFFRYPPFSVGHGMYDYDDGIWILPEEAREFAGTLWWAPAFTCRPVTRRLRPLAAAACRRPLAKPAARLIFTPWVLGKPIRSMNA